MKIPFLQRNSSFRVGFVAGLAAGIVASVVMLFISVTWQGVSLPEVFGSLLTGLMPPPLFEWLHQQIGESAKHILFYGILVGQCLVFGLSGGLYYQRVKMQGNQLRWYHGLLLAFMLWLFAGVILLPLTNAGLFGENLDAGIGLGVLSLALVGLVFGLLFVFFTNMIHRIPASAHRVAAVTDAPHRPRFPASSGGAASDERPPLMRHVVRRGGVHTGVRPGRLVRGRE